ncbi:MAG: hypothetical protein ABIP61_09900 [Burkholderiaceae bacterium]
MIDVLTHLVRVRVPPLFIRPDSELEIGLGVLAEGREFRSAFLPCILAGAARNSTIFATPAVMRHRGCAVPGLDRIRIHYAMVFSFETSITAMHGAHGPARMVRRRVLSHQASFPRLGALP